MCLPPNLQIKLEHFLGEISWPPALQYSLVLEARGLPLNSVPSLIFRALYTLSYSTFPALSSVPPQQVHNSTTQPDEYISLHHVVLWSCHCFSISMTIFVYLHLTIFSLLPHKYRSRKLRIDSQPRNKPTPSQSINI